MCVQRKSSEHCSQKCASTHYDGRYQNITRSEDSLSSTLRVNPSKVQTNSIMVETQNEKYPETLKIKSIPTRTAEKDEITYVSLRVVHSHYSMNVTGVFRHRGETRVP